MQSVIDLLSTNDMVCESCLWDRVENVLHVEYTDAQLDIHFDDECSYLTTDTTQMRFDTSFTEPYHTLTPLDDAFQKLSKVIEIAQLETINILINRGYRLWSFKRALGDQRTWKISSNIMFKEAFVAEVFYALFYLGEEKVLELCQ